MLSSNKVKYFKALTVGVLLAKGSIGMDDNNTKENELSDRQPHQAKFVNTLRSIEAQGDKLREGLRSVDLRGPREPNVTNAEASNMNYFVNNALEVLDKRTEQRRELMRQPRTIDLSIKSFENVRNFLENARRYDVKVKLTVYNLTEKQLNDLLNEANGLVEDDDLDWTYMTPTKYSTLKDPDEETTPTDKGDTPTDTDDEDDDEDETETETETPGYTTKGDGETPLDLERINNPRLRRSVARGRHPLLFKDLVENHGRGVELVVPSKLVYFAPQNPLLDENLPDHDKNRSLGSWNMTLAKNSKDTQNESNVAAPKANQSHHLVNMFCRGRSGMVKAG